jgi:hypothetical protein
MYKLFQAVFLQKTSVVSYLSANYANLPKDYFRVKNKDFFLNLSGF